MIYTELTPQSKSLLARMYPKLTSSQRKRLAALADEWRQLKSELIEVHPVPIEEAEPVLASPRCALHFCDGGYGRGDKE